MDLRRANKESYTTPLSPRLTTLGSSRGFLPAYPSPVRFFFRDGEPTRQGARRPYKLCTCLSSLSAHDFRLTEVILRGCKSAHFEPGRHPVAVQQHWPDVGLLGQRLQEGQQHFEQLQKTKNRILDWGSYRFGSRHPKTLKP